MHPKAAVCFKISAQRPFLLFARAFSARVFRNVSKKEGPAIKPHKKLLLDDPHMYSADGYCIDQGASRAIRYGKCSSAQNGCGWIAAYNLLRIAGNPYPPARVRAGLAPTLWMGGRMGTRVTALWRYLHRRGVTLIPTLRSSKAAEGPGGLAFYYTGKGFHFVAYASAGRPRRYRFLNAVYGRDRLLRTPQQFRKQFFKHGVGLFFRIAEPCPPVPWNL